MENCNKNTTKPYIMCAAIFIDDNTEYAHQPKNISSGIVVCGHRHHNCILIISHLKWTIPYTDVKSQITKNQGFLTSDNIFVNRIEAAKIAFEAGQISELKEMLFSEDLW